MYNMYVHSVKKKADSKLCFWYAKTLGKGVYRHPPAPQLPFRDVRRFPSELAAEQPAKQTSLAAGPLIGQQGRGLLLQLVGLLAPVITVFAQVLDGAF